MEGATSFWHYLIRPDKSATTQFDDLCHGLAKNISELEPGTDNTELTPRRLSAFYRAVGGNYDSLFLKTSDGALSFMYRTLGCYHTLQPRSNPFETPSIPCLTPAGFARWQTLQILLCPEESVPFLQRAVQIYEVPRRDGGYFPKSIPTNCFPDRPDEDMERWHEHVTGALKQEHYVRRIKNSPYQSPHPEPQDRRESYFVKNPSRPGQPPRSRSEDEERDKTAAYRRRSSVPEVVSPLPVGAERGSHWDPATKHQRKARSHSAHRPEPSNRHRAHTASGPPNSYQPTSPHNRRYHSLEQSTLRPPSGQHDRQHRQRPSGGRPISASSAESGGGSEASSEASNAGRRPRHRKSDEEPAARKNSLWVPSFLKSHKRRHSSEANNRNSIIKQPVPPLRPEYYPPKPRKPQGLAPPNLQSPQRQYAGVRFNDHIFDREAHSPIYESPVDPRGPTVRYPDPQSQYRGPQLEVPSFGQPLSGDSSGSSGGDRRRQSEWDRQQQRKSGIPLRNHTVSGVGGRKYANTEPKNGPGDKQRPQVRGNIPTSA